METGTVKRFFDSRGFGFIRDTTNRDIYVHYSEIVGQSGRRTLNVGDRVQFEVGDAGRGPMALNVTVLEAADGRA